MKIYIPSIKGEADPENSIDRFEEDRNKT